jgi:predicted DNA-binding transcriptional regulator YafY
MNRIDRLTAILLLLQARKRTAGEIAGRFEISKRTVLRDIQALCEMGIPIEASSGTTGGYKLLPDYSLPPLALTFHEALLLHLSLRSLSQMGEAPFKRERESLQAKIQTLIPHHNRLQIDQFEQALSFTPPSQPSPIPFFEQLLESAHAQRWLSVTYRSERGVSQQTLLPHRLRVASGLWYCDAYSHERGEQRVYRVDRFLEVRATLAPNHEEESGIPTIAHGHPSLPEVRICLTAHGVLQLEHDPCLGPRIQYRGDGGGGWLCERFRPQDYGWLVRIVLRLGMEAKVLAPLALRQCVQEQSQAIAHHHAE